MEERYDYYEVVMNDVCDRLSEEPELLDLSIDDLYDELINDNDITGLMYSYFNNEFDTVDAVYHNLDIIKHIDDIYGFSKDEILNPFILDTKIRFYMLDNYLMDYIDVFKSRYDVE